MATDNRVLIVGAIAFISAMRLISLNRKILNDNDELIRLCGAAIQNGTEFKSAYEAEKARSRLDKLIHG